MATRVAGTAAPRAWMAPTPRLVRERPSRARRGPVRVVAGDFPLDNGTVAPSEAETLDAFATRVCQRVGRGEEEARAIARTLRANWFETAEDVASLTVDQLVAMGVPARWGQAMRDLSREETDAARLASGEATTSGAASARTRSEDGWIGGALPGPDERLERPTTGRTAVLARDWGSDGTIVSAGASGTRARRIAAVALSSVRVTKRKRLPPYALRDGEVPETLRAELEKMRRDVTTRRVGGGRAPVRRTTAANYEEVARGLMGWLARVKRGGWDGVTPLETGENTRLGSPIVTSEHAPASLSLLDAIPSGDAEGASLAVEYLQWLCEARGIAASTEAFQLRSLIAIAKWLHPPDAFGVEDKTFEKPVVMELVRVQRGGKTLAAKSSHVADEAAKWLDWPAYLALVETLRRECAPLTHLGDQRSDVDVACAVQRYLLFAILASVPDRQRTLRELRLGKTLVCETFDEVAERPSLDDASEPAPASSSGGSELEFVPRRRWVVRHTPEDYKTGNAYGARPDLALDPRLYPALEQWLFGVDFDFDERSRDADVAAAGYSDWGHRAALAPTHDFVFSRPNGSPWTVSELSRTFSRASLRLTGKKTNPHLVRDMVVTHVRSAGVASDAELEALAMYMGHSVAMQKGTYDRRTTQQKVAPAVGLMSAINAGGGGEGEKKKEGHR